MRAGFVALVGRPNVGKSTLLNKILGEKLAIASSRPQTTRERMLGVLNKPGLQIAFVDTPGLHRPGGAGRTRLNQFMVDEAKAALSSVDVLVLLVDVSPDSDRRPPPRHHKNKGKASAAKAKTKPVLRFDQAALGVIEDVKAAKKPTIIAFNKVDQLRDKSQMLPLLQQAEAMGFAAMVPISARTGSGVDALLEELGKLIPEGEALFDEDTLTDRAERWFVTEFIREQCFLLTKREVPYSVAVAVEEFEEGKTRDGKRQLKIGATISVDKEAHKRIIVGAAGSMIREIGTRARHELAERLDAVVHLTLFVRVDEGWTADRSKLRDFGYESSGRE